MNLTPWFDGSVKPARVGVYERSFSWRYAYWTGEYWCIGDFSFQTADEPPWVKDCRQNIAWRGLTEQQP